jgi:phosphatidylglycerophosphatase A
MSASGEQGSQNKSGLSEVPFLAKFIATGFYSGLSPWASGTVGTVVGVLLYLIPGFEQLPVLAGMIVAGFFAGVFASARVADTVGNRLTESAKLAKSAFQSSGHKEADPSMVVIDEMVGMWISLLFLPKTYVVIVTAFVMFRVFDIIKPPPAQRLERVPHGWGIMLDDVVAGLYACAATHLMFLAVNTILPLLEIFQ